MSLLESMLANYSPAPRVVSEEHNPNAINFVAGLSDPGEMIRCGYRPELRRHPGEQDAKYAVRIHPLVMALPQEEQDVIMGAALKRASLDVTGGRVSVMVAGEPAWHGLGVNVAEAVTAADAIRLANLGWEVLKLPLYFEQGDTLKLATGRYALVRKDTGEYLNHTGPIYQVIQNAEAFSFLDEVIGKHHARYETAGAIHGGRKIWCQVKMPEQSFNLNGTDQVDAYAMFTNSHGDEAAWCFGTSHRTVCANTFRTASFGRKKGISIRHTGNVRSKVADARRALGLAAEAATEFKVAAETMAATPLRARPYFEGLLDSMLQLTDAEQAVKAGNVLEAMLTDDDVRQAEKSLARKEQKRATNLESMLERYEEDRNGLGGMRGTAWAAFNAATEFANHEDQGRRRADGIAGQTRRFESVLDGDRDDLMQVAYQMATAAVN